MVIVIEDGLLAFVSLIRMVALVLVVVAEIALVVFTLMLVALVPIPVVAESVTFPAVRADEESVMAPLVEVMEAAAVPILKVPMAKAPALESVKVTGTPVMVPPVERTAAVEYWTKLAVPLLM